MLAFPEKPLATKLCVISQGVSATLDLATVGDVYQDFDIAAKRLSCNYGGDAEAELDCMRLVSWVQIEEYINPYNATPAVAFTNCLAASNRHLLASTRIARYLWTGRLSLIETYMKLKSRSIE
jgi:hypothetical protein